MKKGGFESCAKGARINDLLKSKTCGANTGPQCRKKKSEQVNQVLRNRGRQQVGSGGLPHGGLELSNVRKDMSGNLFFPEEAFRGAT